MEVEVLEGLGGEEGRVGVCLLVGEGDLFDSSLSALLLREGVARAYLNLVG